jgi:hypothetical protein
MHVHRRAVRHAVGLQALLDHARRHAVPRVLRNRALLPSLGAGRTASQAAARPARPADRHRAALVALAGDDDFAVAGFHPARLSLAWREVQPGQFGHPQAARIQQFEHGAVAQLGRFGRGAGAGGAATRARRPPTGARQGLGAFRRAHALYRVGRQRRLLAEPVEKPRQLDSLRAIERGSSCCACSLAVRRRMACWSMRVQSSAPDSAASSCRSRA